MWRVFGGAFLVVGGIAGFIEAHSNRPVAATPGLAEGNVAREVQLTNAGIDTAPHPASGLSPVAYDLLRIGAWALVIFGALLVAIGLIGFWVRTKSASLAR